MMGAYETSALIKKIWEWVCAKLLVIFTWTNFEYIVEIKTKRLKDTKTRTKKQRKLKIS